MKDQVQAESFLGSSNQVGRQRTPDRSVKTVIPYPRIASEKQMAEAASGSKDKRSEQLQKQQCKESRCTSIRWEFGHLLHHIPQVMAVAMKMLASRCDPHVLRVGSCWRTVLVTTGVAAKGRAKLKEAESRVKRFASCRAALSPAGCHR